MCVCVYAYENWKDIKTVKNNCLWEWIVRGFSFFNYMFQPQQKDEEVLELYRFYIFSVCFKKIVYI